MLILGQPVILETADYIAFAVQTDTGGKCAPYFWLRPQVPLRDFEEDLALATRFDVRRLPGYRAGSAADNAGIIRLQLAAGRITASTTITPFGVCTACGEWRPGVPCCQCGSLTCEQCGHKGSQAKPLCWRDDCARAYQANHLEEVCLVVLPDGERAVVAAGRPLAVWPPAQDGVLAYLVEKSMDAAMTHTLVAGESGDLPAGWSWFVLPALLAQQGVYLSNPCLLVLPGGDRGIVVNDLVVAVFPAGGIPYVCPGCDESPYAFRVQPGATGPHGIDFDATFDVLPNPYSGIALRLRIWVCARGGRIQTASTQAKRAKRDSARSAQRSPRRPR